MLSRQGREGAVVGSGLRQPGRPASWHPGRVPAWALGFVPLLLVATGDAWVYLDASARRGTRREVTATFLSLDVETPRAWLLWCLVLFVVFFPAYLVARRTAA